MPRPLLPPPSTNLLPLGAIAAGFGLLHLPALAQTQQLPAPPAAAASAAMPETTMPVVTVRAKVETDANSLRATTTTIGRGVQELRDIPQSVTVVTEKQLEDRRVNTLKEALHQTGGITFQAAEGGEEDVRLRGFSLATSGDIYVDSLRDPAFYERDTFSYDRIELLRGSASMLFGRGSTGGVVNQVQKQAYLTTAGEVNASYGSGDYKRLTADFNLKLGETAGLRINAMKTKADQWGNSLDKEGVALNLRYGIGTDDEFSVSGYYLKNDNGVNYGLPWLRTTPAAMSATNKSGLIPGLSPKVYYAAASDYNDGKAAYGTVGWTHRFGDGGVLRASLRQGFYDRDLRASTIRFFVPAGGTQPSLTGPVQVSDSTLLNRGVQNKVQDLHTTYGLLDYANTFNVLGRKNEVLTGLDLAHEVRQAYTMIVPAGVTLDKNNPRPTLGSPDDGTGYVDEGLRQKRRAADFDAKSAGVFVQDLLQVAESWKLLAGLRWDKFKGDYGTYQTAAPTAQVPNPPAPGTQLTELKRDDSLWSKRFGVLYQPTDTQSYYASYGTSFNTSGDAFQYDPATANTGPEKSRNIEVGGKLDLLDGDLSLRTSFFHTTKYNERNRDSPTNLPLPSNEYLLSGKRHAYGVDLDFAGRILPGWEVYGSYAFIPVARIDKGNPLDNSTLTGELVGQRPSLTPKHSGTVWTTYQLLQPLRVGAGVNFRSAQTPNRNPAGITAPHWTTGDLFAEYAFTDQVSFKVNVLNVTNRYYADVLYTNHYVQGPPRTVTGTLTLRF